MNADPSTPALAHADSLEVREYLAEALRLDLVGPGVGDDLAEERLPGWVRPSNWYLTGFLIPSDTPYQHRSDADEDDPLDDDTGGGWPCGRVFRGADGRKEGILPVVARLELPRAGRAPTNSTVTVRWGDYEKTDVRGCGRRSRCQVWQRHGRRSARCR